MVVIGSGAFAVLVWGTLLAVLAVFCYELYALGVEYGWVGIVADGSRSRWEER